MRDRRPGHALLGVAAVAALWIFGLLSVAVWLADFGVSEKLVLQAAISALFFGVVGVVAKGSE